MYKKYHVLQKPESIFVVTELKIAASSRASAYIACNARGTPLPPFVVFHNDPIDTSRLTAYGLPEFKDALFFNAKGTHDGDALFVWFRDHFLRCRTSYEGRSLILFVSCPVSEISLRLVQLAEEEHVVLMSVPSGVAHLVQPLSCGILRCLNAAVSAGIEQLVTDGKLTSSKTVAHSLLATLLAEVWADKWSCDDVREAFALCGIFPLNICAITAERIAAAASDNIADSCITNESSEDIDDVTHGLNLLSELSTLEQEKESYTEAPQQCYKNVKLDVREIVDDASASAGSHHNCLQRQKRKVSREVLKCFIDEDKGNEPSTCAYSNIPSSVVCQSHMCTGVTSRNDCDQFDHTESSAVVRKKHSEHGTQHIITTTELIKASDYNSSIADMSSVNGRESLPCDETCADCEQSLAFNSSQNNVADAVGSKVVEAGLIDLYVGVNDVRQQSASTDTRLNEPNDYPQSVFCDSGPVCCEPQLQISNALQVIYYPSVDSSMHEQDDSDRRECTQIESDVTGECDIEDSCQQVCCEVII